jgi:hypothetical protein
MRILTFVLLFFTGCSTLIGNVKPVDEKAEHYRILDLESENDRLWKKLPSEKTSTESSEVSDVVFQTLDHRAIISLNSACREIEASTKKLPGIAQELTLGFTDVEVIDEKWTEVNHRTAYQKTLEGKFERQKTKIRVVVIAADKCVYDFSYIASPNLFPAHEKDFTRFVNSLSFR